VRDRIRLLSLVVTTTVLLLAGSAVLVVLGIFNGYLQWDLFSPEIQKVLYGVFGSFVALGAFGAAISFVLGIQEVVLSFRRLTDRAGNAGNAVAPVESVTEPAPSSATPRKTSWRFYPVALTALLLLLAFTILGFNYANHRVLAHRLQVFKLIVRDQMTQLGPRLASEVAHLGAPCDTCGTPTLEQLLKTLENLSFCRSAVLYLPDPQDATVLWRYPATTGCSSCGKYNPERFFIARDLDRAVHLALTGDTAWIDQMNRDPMFHWYHVIRGADGKGRAVLEIWGNDKESFRDYEAGAKAAAKRG
jgi:hypothetical protein